MLIVNSAIRISEDELREEFVRSPGPGGQHVNKTASAVRLTFDARNSTSLPSDVCRRLLRTAGAKATSEGVIVIEAHEHRSQKRNRETARERLAEMIRAAIPPPKKRTRTKPTRASKQRRLSDKKVRSETKRLRGRVNRDD